MTAKGVGITKMLCLVFIVAAGCNTNSGNRSSGQSDTSTSASAADHSKVQADTAAVSAVDSAARARFNAVKIDNLDCPVCRRPLMGCVEDTASYAGRLVGFDRPQCRADFVKTPGTYKLK